MASGQEILSYQGSGGLGSNSDVPAVSTKDLDIISQTADRLQAQNAYQNHAIFAQKIKDRDALIAAIDSADIKVGDLLEEDASIVKEGLQKLDDAYFARIKKGINDIDAAREYNKAKREAQDRVTQAQARKLFHDSLSGKIASETLPRKQTAMKDHLDKTIKKGFFADLTPYQQTQDLDIAGSILSTAANISEQYTDPKNPLMKGTRTMFDYDKTLLNNKDNFLNDVNKQHDQQQLIARIESLPPDEFLENMTSMNNRINEYNALRGFSQGQPGYVAPIKFGVDKQTGQAVIEENLPDFSAKYTLGHQKPFGSVETKFAKDEAAYKLGQQRNAIAATNAAANLRRANAYVALQNKKLSQLNDEEKRVKNFWGGVTGKVKSETGGDVVYAGDLPKGYTYIGGLDENGKPIQLIPKKTSGGREYFETRYFDSSGATTDPRVMYKEYIDFQRKNNSNVETYDALLQRLMNAGKINMELVGQNGVGNFETAGQTSRAISNKGTSKGEEPIFYDDQQEE